ncbi:MAG: hypothetical protein ACSLE0_15870, partial [Chitinophagaceae bacterium]
MVTGPGPMILFRLQISVLVFLLTSSNAAGQNNYPLHIRCVDKDSSFIFSDLGLKSIFATRNDCVAYINQLQGYLQTKGFVTASLDSVKFDSAAAAIVLFAGSKYEWAQLDTKQIDPVVL